MSNSHAQSGHHQGGAAQAGTPGAFQTNLPCLVFFKWVPRHEDLQILKHACRRPAPQQGESVAHCTVVTVVTSAEMSLSYSQCHNVDVNSKCVFQLKRASSDDALAKPTLVAAGSRMKKTVTTGAISDLADARPRSLSGKVQFLSTKCMVKKKEKKIVALNCYLTYEGYSTPSVPRFKA